MQGIWPPDGDLTDINACVARGSMIVTADDFGKVNVFNNPSLQWCAPSMVHHGHSAHATNVRFNADASRVISVGGSDRCIFVWRVVQNDVGGAELFEIPKEAFGAKRKKVKKKTKLTKRELEEKMKVEAQVKLHKSRAAAVERGLKARQAEWAERQDLQRQFPSGSTRRTMRVGRSDHSTLGDVGPRHDDIELTQFVGEGLVLQKKELPSTSYFATDGKSLNHTMLHAIGQAAPSTIASRSSSTDGPTVANVPSVDDRYIEELHDLADAVTDLATMQIDFTTPKRRRRDKTTGRPVSGPSNGVYDGTGVPMPRLRMPKHLATTDMLHKWELRKQFRDRKEAIVVGENVASMNPSSLAAPVRPDGSPMPFHARSPRSPTYRALVSSRSPDAFFNARRFASYGGYMEANSAASQIQAMHRGRQARRRVIKNQQEVKASVKIQSIHRGREARRESLKRQKARTNAQKGGGVHRLGDKHLDAEGSFIQHTERQIAKIEQAAMEKEEIKLKLAKSSKFSMRRRRGSTGGGGGGSSFGIVTGRLDVKEFSARHGKMKAGEELPQHSMEGLPWVDRVRRARPRAAAMTQGPLSDKSTEPIRHFLQLNHVHGFRSQDMRNNVMYTASGDVLLIAATIGICVNLKTNVQRYMSEHDDDIVSVAMTNVVKKRDSYSRVATGDSGRHPKIVIWETHTMRVLTVLKDSNQHRGITKLAFTGDGLHLASIGLGRGKDGGHKQAELFIHNWKKRSLLVRHLIGGEKVFGLSFWPSDPTRLITCGVRHMKFWHCTGAKRNTIHSVSARFGRKLEGFVSVLDVCYDRAGRAIGASNQGHLLVWVLKPDDTTCRALGNGSVRYAHQGVINTLAVVPGGERILSGGIDGRVCVWFCDSDVKAPLMPGPVYDSIKFTMAPSVLEASLQSLSVSVSYSSPDDKHILMGTRGGDVVAIKLNDGSLVQRKPIMVGHHQGELWGLAAHPSDSEVFATSGDDCTVRIWHTELKSCFAVSKPGVLKTKSRAICYSPGDGEFLAAGLGGIQGRNRDKASGDLVLLDSENLHLLYELSVAKDSISDVSWSFDACMIAVASHDKCIYLVAFKIEPELKLETQFILEGHAGDVQHVSFSRDGEWLMSNDIAGDLHFWSTVTGKDASRKMPDSIRKAKWFPNKCPLNWAAIGIWPEDANKLDINACETRGDYMNGESNELGGDYIVSADEFGNVKLFNAPITQWCAPSMVHRGHSAHVTNVCFNADGSKVFSTGGEDRCVFVWTMSQI
jgi:WD40 repeat protein